jgi:hypothetical protein
MKLIFTYSLSSEIAVVRETLRDSEFIIKNNYQYWLPGGIELNSENKNIKEAICNELNSKGIERARAKIQKAFIRHSKDLDYFAQSLRLQAPDKIIVVLTKYGTGGSYELPNKMVLNIASAHNDPCITFVHEFVHLLVEESIVKTYNLSHWQKEGLVDYLILHNPHLQKISKEYSLQKEAILPTKEQLKQWFAY